MNVNEPFTSNGESMPPENDEFKKRLQAILDSTQAQLMHAQGSYGESWIKRGGIGAFMNLARKWDRIQMSCKRAGWDIMKALEMDRRPEGLIDDLRDLRDYIILVDEYWTRDNPIEQYVKEILPVTKDLPPDSVPDSENKYIQVAMPHRCLCNHLQIDHQPSRGCGRCGCGVFDRATGPDPDCFCGHDRVSHEGGYAPKCNDGNCTCPYYTLNSRRDDDPVHPQ